MADDDELRLLALDDHEARDARRNWARRHCAMARTDQNHHQAEIARLEKNLIDLGPGAAFLGGVGFVLVPFSFYLYVLAFEAITASAVGAFCAAGVCLAAGLAAGLVESWESFGLPQRSAEVIRAGFVFLSGFVMTLASPSAWSLIWFFPLGLLSGVCLIVLPKRSLAVIAAARCMRHRRSSYRAAQRLAHYTAQLPTDFSPAGRMPASDGA